MDWDGSDKSTIRANDSLTASQWYYLAYSLTMENGTDTKVSIYIDNVSDAFVQTLGGYFLVDASSHKGFIGAQRTLSQS